VKYRKKPVVIEAVKVPNHEYADDPSVWPEAPHWLQQAWESGDIKPVFRGEDYWYYAIQTLEGEMLAGPDDMLIQGVQGEVYPCKPDIFLATYDPVDS
jgi:hypothetical protein